jgi:hypothetical protein
VKGEEVQERRKERHHAYSKTDISNVQGHIKEIKLERGDAHGKGNR